MDVAGYSFAICQLMGCAAAGAAHQTTAARTSEARRRHRSISGGAAREEVHARGGHDHLAVLVPQLHDGANDPAVWLASRGGGFEHGQAAGERVPGADGLEPAQLVEAGGPEARRVLEETLAEKTHQHAARVPTARDEPAPDTRLGGILVSVKGLGVELAREAQHALLLHGAAAEIDDVACLDVI